MVTTGNKPVAVGMYIFAGGFTLGVRNHFIVPAHLEDGQFGVKTARHNFPSIHILSDKAKWPMDIIRHLDPGLLYGNPPCAPWSIARSGANNSPWEDDPRLECAETFMTTAMDLGVPIAVWESVAQAYTRGRSFVDEWTHKYLMAGYAVTHQLTDGIMHGMPQRRRRFLFWAHKVEIPFGDPEPSWVTVDQALASVEEPDWYQPVSALTHELWTKSLPGQSPFNLLTKGERDAYRGQGIPSYSKKRLRGDAPSNTVAGVAVHMHPHEARNLANNEVAALCGYPPDFEFQGTPSSILPQMARAVLPRLEIT